MLRVGDDSKLRLRLGLLVVDESDDGCRVFCCCRCCVSSSRFMFVDDASRETAAAAAFPPSMLEVLCHATAMQDTRV